MKTYHGYVRFSTLIDDFIFIAENDEAAEEYMRATSRAEYKTYRTLFDCPSYEDCVGELKSLESNFTEEKAKAYYEAMIDSFVDYWFEEKAE